MGQHIDDQRKEQDTGSNAEPYRIPRQPLITTESLPFSCGCCSTLGRIETTDLVYVGVSGCQPYLVGERAKLTTTTIWPRAKCR